MFNRRLLFRSLLGLVAAIVISLGAGYSPASADSPSVETDDAHTQTSFSIYLPAIQHASSPLVEEIIFDAEEIEAMVQSAGVVQSAGARGDDCKGNNHKWFYLYDRNDYSHNYPGSPRRLQYNDVGFWQDLRNASGGGAFHDQASSLFNDTQCKVIVLDIGTGVALRLSPGAKVRLTGWLGWYDNRIDLLFIEP